jgi:methyl-accepting chemotaxis protein
VVEPDRIDTLVERTPRRLSLQSRVFLAGALPMLLSIILVGLTLHQAVPPMLHTLMQGTARTSATALATAVQPLLHNQSDLSNPLLGQTLGASQQGLQGQKVEFVFLTDTKGNPLQGWNAAGEGRETLPQDLLQPLKAQASLSANGVTSQVVVLPDQTIVIAAAPLMGQGQTVGSLVMGINALGFAEGFQDVLRNVLLVGLLPVFLAILAALMVTRRMARTVMQLTRAADRIGMGDLSTEIGVRTGDELELLSHAMDRMRVGLQKHIERQKRR